MIKLFTINALESDVVRANHRDYSIMRRHTNLVHIEQTKMAQRSLKDTVHFKLYSTEQTTINYTYLFISCPYYTNSQQRSLNICKDNLIFAKINVAEVH